MIYYPGAFTPAAREIIECLVAPSQRIALKPDDAARFSANAVSFGSVVIMSGVSERLARALTERGYVLVTTPLDSFLKSGGSACCLTLRLDHGLQAAREAPVQTRRGRVGVSSASRGHHYELWVEPQMPVTLDRQRPP